MTNWGQLSDIRPQQKADVLQAVQQAELFRRQQYKKFVRRCVLLPLVVLVVGLATYGVGWLALNVPEKSDKPFPYVFFFFSALPVFYWWQKPRADYQKRFKMVVPARLATLFPDGAYEFARPVTRERPHILASKLIGGFDDRLSKVSDYFSFTHKNIQVHVQQLELEEDAGEDSFTVFKGVFVRMVFPQNFPCHLLMLKDKGVLNWLHGKHALSRVVLESGEFEKMFEVYANNQIAARTVITPAFMSRVLLLAEQYKKHLRASKIQMSIWDNQVFLRIDTPQDVWAAPRINRPLDDVSSITQTVEEMFLLVALVHQLKLDAFARE